MRERAPDVLDFMATAAIPKLKGNDGRQVMPFCTAYGILMNVRSRELSLVQKMLFCWELEVQQKRSVNL